MASTLFTASHDNTVKLWDAASGACRQTFRGHAGWVRRARSRRRPVRAVGRLRSSGQDLGRNALRRISTRTAGTRTRCSERRFSPDGKQIITVSRDRTAKIQDLVAGRAPTTLSEGHAFLVSTVAFSPDGSRVFTGAGDDTVRVWDAITGGELRQFENTGRGGIFALSRDGRLMLTGSEGGNALLWDVTTGNVLHTLVGTSLGSDRRGHLDGWQAAVHGRRRRTRANLGRRDR